jgi:hypothetical protein
MSTPQHNVACCMYGYVWCNLLVGCNAALFAVMAVCEGLHCKQAGERLTAQQWSDISICTEPPKNQ